MKSLLIVASMLFATLLMAQQQAPPPYAPPAHETPSPADPGQKPLPGAPDTQAGQMPPDTKAPAASELSTSDMQRMIEQKLRDEPMMSDANITVSVDDKSVVLQGVVDGEKQHDLAMHVAQGCAGNRPIVDKLTVRQKS